VGQEVVHAQGQAGGAAVDDAEVAGAVADARGGDAEQLAEGVAWHGRPRSQGGRAVLVSSVMLQDGGHDGERGGRAGTERTDRKQYEGPALGVVFHGPKRY